MEPDLVLSREELEVIRRNLLKVNPSLADQPKIWNLIQKINKHLND